MTGKRFQMSRVVKTLGVIAIAAVALTACRADEQGRMIRYEPGVYKGKPDTQLSDSKVQELRDRTLKQGGSISAGFSGGGTPRASGPDVRAPGALNERALKQGGAK